MGEVGGPAADDADPGALLAARLHRSIRDSSIDIASPCAPFAEDLGEVAAGLASARARTRSASSGVDQLALIGLRPLPGDLDQAPGGDEELAAGVRVGGVVGRRGRPRSRRGRTAGGRGGGGACRRRPRRRSRRPGRAGPGAASDGVIRRSPLPPPPAARSRRTERMSKNISEASAKRSVTATAVSPSWRTAKTSPCSVATWTCSTGSPPARRRPPAAPRRLGPALGARRLAASTAPSASRIAPPRISGDISVR